MPDVVDEFGLQVATLDELRAKNAADVRAAPEFSADADVAVDTVMGSLFEPVNAQLDDVRQLLRSIADANDPDNAEGVALDSVSALSGVKREDATQSEGTVTLGGVPTTVITAGSRVKLPTIDDTDAELLADATIGGGGTVDATFRAIETGPINYPAPTALTIVTPIAGWTSAVVQADFSRGRNIEINQELRIRRGNSLALGGNGTPDAIGSAVQQLPDVDFAVAIENDTLPTDAKDIPGKAMRVVVHPTTVNKQRIIDTMYAVWPGGIKSNGSERFTVLTSKGQEKEFGFDFAAELPIFVVVIVTKLAGYGGDDAVKKAVTDFGDDSINVGTDVEPAEIVCRIKDDVAGAGNPEVRIGLAPAPTQTDTIPVDVDQIATFDVADISVVERL
ncbi:MAG: baseplate J/gp47 family protein [Kiloniellales bacterium]